MIDPAHSVGLGFEDLFDLAEIQELQDRFAAATGVASLITSLDGRPLTRPSNFCRFCSMIRGTARGFADCEAFSRAFGRLSLERPTMLPCLPGLPSVAAPICANGKPLGLWRIEQVWTEDTDLERLLLYARDVGLDEREARDALDEMPRMSEAQFRAIGEYLLLNARLLSRLALMNAHASREVREQHGTVNGLLEDRRRLQLAFDESTRMAEALRESEARFRNVVQRSPMGTYLYELREDDRLVLIDANVSADRFTHIDTRTLLGMVIEDAFPNLADTEIPDRFRAAARDGVSWEVRDLRYHDERIDGRFDVYAFQTSPGRMAVNFVDVTERHRIEETIRDREQRLTSLVRALPCMVGTIRNRTLVSVNERVSEMLGYAPEELVGRSTRMLYAADEEYERVGRVLYGDPDAAVATTDTHWRHKDGEMVDVVVSLAPIHPGDPASDCVIAALDMTRRNRAERQRDRFFNLSTDPLCIAGFDGRFILVNPAWTRVLGWRADELIGRAWIDLVHPDDRDATIAAGERLLSGGTVQQFENRYITRDGSYRWLSWDSFPLLEEQTVFAVVRDVTEQRNAEQEKARLEAQLRHSLKMEAVGQLAGGVAHDFNNLLQVIVGYTELASFGLEVSHPAAAALEEVRRAAERATTLTRQLLTFSRRDSHAPRAVDLNAVVQNLVKMLERLIGENVELHLCTRSGVPQVYADPGQIEQVVLNLCINARDAMPEGGRLCIETATESTDANGAMAVLSVTDTGHGIDPEIRDRLFEPFFTTKPVGQGTGLGLATVYAIVARHSGQIEVDSVPGHGATFRVRLPAAPSDLSALENVDAADHVPGGTETLLLAEDDELVRNLALAVLAQAGYRVIVAKDGVEATDLFDRHAGEIDAAVLDIVMPRRGGREVLAGIRRHHPDLPVILTSGYSYAAGTPPVEDDRTMLMLKPYPPRDILRALRTVLDRA